MKYIRLPNGKEMEFYDYAVTNALIVKFVDADFNDIKNFFGNSIIKYIEVLDETKRVIEQKQLGGMKRTTINIESGTIKRTDKKLVSEAYDETVSVIIGQDNEGNDITGEQVEHHEAVYEYNTVDVPVEFTVAILERPSIEERLDEVTEQVGMVDVSSLDLDGWKNYKQEENKKLFAEFLADSTVEFNGKPYGVTEEDQSEMSLNYMQYQISKNAGLDATLEWHAKKEKCVSFEETDFLMLCLMVKSFVYPYMNLMQEYKEQIFACKSIDDVKTIEIKYGNKNESKEGE